MIWNSTRGALVTSGLLELLSALLVGLVNPYSGNTSKV